MAFKEIDIKDLKFNPFSKIGDEWALLTSGNVDKGFNTMTASWAGFGMFWGKNAVTVYIRESRYTRRFFDSNECFTVSFYDDQYRKALEICGRLHGDKCDKVKEAGLTPYPIDQTTAFHEANMIFFCRKLFHTDVTKIGTDDTAVFDRVYPEPDYHRIFIGEVLKVLVKD